MSDKPKQTDSEDDSDDDQEESPTLLEQLKMAKISVQIVVMVQKLLM